MLHEIANVKEKHGAHLVAPATHRPNIGRHGVRGRPHQGGT
jgi:hypothetical protein